MTALLVMAPPAAGPAALPLTPAEPPAVESTPAPADESASVLPVAEAGQATDLAKQPSTSLEAYGNLRMADSLSRLPEKKIGSRPPARPVQVPEASPSAPVRVDEAVVAQAPVAEARARELPVIASLSPSLSLAESAARPAKIEKIELLGSPRERAESQYRKAIAVVNQGRVSEALAGLRSALGHDGYHVGSRQLLAKLLLEAGHRDEAIVLLHEGVQAQPAQLGWAMSLARLQLENRDLAAAWQTLNYSLPAAGHNADYQGFAAHVLQRLGRNKEAAEHYQAAARLSPGDGRWWLGLGLALEAEGRPGEARESFVRARSSGNLGVELMAFVEQKLR